jgi:hypothetical protein
MKKLFIFSVVLWTGCTKDTFPKYIELNDLRVIALQTATPEVVPGTLLTIDPYVSDINNTAPLTFIAEGCVDISYGAEPSCNGNPTMVSLGTGSAGTLSGPTFTGSLTSFNATIPAAILVGRSAAETYNGVNYLITYAITNAQGKTVKSFRRIIVSDPSKPKNSNPTVPAVFANGVSLGLLAPGVAHEMTMTFGASSAETYNRMKTDGSMTTVTEELTTTWFITDGLMKFYRTSVADVNAYTTPESYPTTRSSFILVVVRDGRGGLSLLQTVIH